MRQEHNVSISRKRARTNTKCMCIIYIRRMTLWNTLPERIIRCRCLQILVILGILVINRHHYVAQDLYVNYGLVTFVIIFFVRYCAKSAEYITVLIRGEPHRHNIIYLFSSWLTRQCFFKYLYCHSNIKRSCIYKKKNSEFNQTLHS